MSATGVVTIQTAPRDANQLFALLGDKRGIFFRLGHQLQIFPDEAAEQAFLGAPEEHKAQVIAAALQQWDAMNGGTAAATQATMAQPMPAMPQQQQQPVAAMTGMPGMPGMPQVQPPQPTMQPMAQPQPQMQAPQQPVAAMPGMPPMPQVQPPPPPAQAPMAPPQPQMQQAPSMPISHGQPGMPPMPGMPNMAAPVMPGQPQMPAAPQQAQQAMPQMPQPGNGAMPGMPAMPAMSAPPQMQMQPQMQAPVPRAPQTASDPSNAGADVQTALSGAPGDMVKQLLTKYGELARALKTTGEKNVEWYEELQEGQQQLMHMLGAVLQTQIYLAEQTLGTNADTLGKLVKHSGTESMEIYLQHFEEDDEGNG